MKNITKTGQIVTEHVYRPDRIRETRFNPEGYEKKQLTRSSPYRDRLVEFTQEIADRIEKETLIGKLQSKNFAAFSLDQLRRIDAILKESKA